MAKRYKLLALSFINSSISILAYSIIFNLIIEIFNRFRLGGLLLELIYVSSLVLATGLSVSVILSACSIDRCQDIGAFLEVFIQKFRFVIVLGAAGSLMGLLVTYSNAVSAWLFYADIIFAGIYTVSVALWFITGLSDLVSHIIGLRRDTLCWLISLFTASLLMAFLRHGLIKFFPSLQDPVICLNLDDEVLSSLIAKYAPSYAEIIVAPIWSTIVPWIYYWILIHAWVLDNE